MDPSVHVILGLLVVSLVLSGFAYASIALDNRWRARHPSEKSFRWGYFQALFFFPGSTLCIPFVLHSMIADGEWRSLLTLFCCIIYSYAGFILITQKKRWAWLFVVLAQFNLIVWLIDLTYGQNRWSEFRK